MILAIEIKVNQILNSERIKSYAEEKIRANGTPVLGDNFTMLIDPTAGTLTVTTIIAGVTTVTVLNLSSDLNICPLTLYDYYLYRLDYSGVKVGDAIYIQIPNSSTTVTDGHEVNAIINSLSSKQIGYFTIVSRGPSPEWLTAREIYTHSYHIYKYEHA